MDGTLLLPYQIFYITTPLIGILGNFAMIYVTIRCRKLRSVCNVLIALISAGYIMQLFSHLVMVISYNISSAHKTRLETCLYWQILPFFSTGHAEILLLCVTIDRLLSVRKFYYHFVYSYKLFYTTSLIIVATGLGVCLTSIAYLYKGPNDKKVICTIIAPFDPLIQQHFLRAFAAINIFILLCYALIFRRLRKTVIVDVNTRGMYRSLIIFTITVVFGWFATALVATIINSLHLNIDALQASLLSGFFKNTTISVNFLIYYFNSKLYREAFDHYIYINSMRKIIGGKDTETTSTQIRYSHHTVTGEQGKDTWSKWHFHAKSTLS